jgi:predicted dehydrogenase
MQQVVRFGLAGAGEIGRLRAAALRRVPGCRLEAVADPAGSRAQSVAQVSGARAFEDWKRMLGEASLEAVIVSTPPHLHEQIAVAALEAGKHVLCEKPLAPTVESCGRILDCARRHGLSLATGFNQRYFPAVQFVKQVLDRGELGRLRHVKAYAGHGGLPEFRQAWEHDSAVVGGGTLMDNGIHLIDHVRFLLGEVEEVYGFSSSEIWKLNGSEDNGFALLRGPNDAVASLHSSWSEWRGYRFSIEVFGDRGMARASYGPMMATAVRLEGPGGPARRERRFFPWVAVREKLQGWQSTVRLTFEQELRDFLGLIEGRPGSIADGVAGMRAVEIAHAVYASSRSRAPVVLRRERVG